MTPAPQVSVVVPNYNHARFLRRRLESVLAQTHGDIEVIVLDDASTDDSLAVIGAFAGDARVRTVRNRVNSASVFRQWNRGVRLARGEFVWIAESDDDADPRFLETVLAPLRADRGVGLSYCRSERIDRDGRSLGAFEFWHRDRLNAARWENAFRNDGRDECRRFLVVENTIPNASGVVFRRNAYLAAGGADESMRLCGDWDMWVRILERSAIAYDSRMFNRFRRHARTVTEQRLQTLQTQREWFRIQSRILRRTGVDAALRNWILERLSQWYVGAWSRQEGLRIRDHAAFARLALRIAPSLLPAAMVAVARRRRWRRQQAAKPACDIEGRTGESEDA